MSTAEARLSCSRFLAGTFLLASMVGTPARAQSGRVGSEFQVNTFTTGDQGYPAVASDPAGNFVVVWSSAGDGDGFGIFARRYDAGGAPLDLPFQVNDYTTGSQAIPGVASDGAGNFTVVWQGSDDGDAYGVFGRRFDAGGVSIGGDFQVNTYTTGYQFGPGIAANAAGDFVVVWNSLGQDGSATGVFGQLFSSGGAAVGAEFQVNVYTTSHQAVNASPTVAMDPGGGFVVVWQDSHDFPGPPGEDGDGNGVFARRYASNGAPLDSEFQVNSYTPGDQQTPAVTSDAAGNFLVVWQSLGLGVIARPYTSGGVAAGPERLLTVAASSQPALAGDASGNFVVTWHAEGGDSNEIFGQRYDDTATPVAAEFQVNTYTSGQQLYSSVAAGAAGFVVVWRSYGQDGSGDGLFGQLFAGIACGNGALDPGEQCDDGNPVAGDGCRGDCTPEQCGDGRVDPGEACDDGNVQDGDGCSAACGEQAASELVTDNSVAAGETVTSDGESDGATSADPVETSVTSSADSSFVGIVEGSVVPPGVSNYRFLGLQVGITVNCSTPPCPTASSPIAIVFRLDASRIPFGESASTLHLFKDGAPVASCPPGATTASPDPCVLGAGLPDGDVQLTVLTSSASDWTFAFVEPVVAVSAQKLLIKDDPDPTKRKIVFKSKDGHLAAAAPGSAGDPRCGAIGGGGASLQVFGTGGSGQSVSVMLPCENWQTIGEPADGKGYKYKDREQDQGPCKTALLRGGKRVSVVCTGKNPASPLGYDLTTGEGSVGVVLGAGAALHYCTELGGAAVSTDDGERFSASSAPPPSSCPAP